MRFYSLFVCCFLICFQVLAQKTVNSWSSYDSIRDAHVSYSFVDIKSGQKLASHNENKLLNPASTLKLLTSLIFLETFGREHQFVTHVSYSGNIEKDGTLNGDLIIKGSGDPTFGSSRFENTNSMDSMIYSIIQAVKSNGIECIEGEIVIDLKGFSNDCTPHSWQFNDLGNYYAAGVWGLNVNENQYELNLGRSMSVGGEVKLQKILPEIPNLYFKNELTLGPKNSGDNAYIFCAPYQNYAVIRGTIPVGKTDFTLKGSIPDVPIFFASTLKNALHADSVKTIGIRVIYDSEDLEMDNQKIWEHKGIPTFDQVQIALEESVNLYCEAFLLKLGNGNREKGIRFMINYLVSNGLIKTGKEIKISDGSGLSQRNYVSTALLSNFLKKQYFKIGEAQIFELLAQNGKEGTLKNAFKSKNLNGNIYGKSGSMDGVKAYAGFLKTKKSKTLAFSIMVNNYTADSRTIYLHIEKLIEQMWLEN